MSSESNNFITEKNIVIGLDASSKEDAIAKLAQVMEENGTVSNAEAFQQDVLYRESLTTTGIGNGIAIPHGKSDSVTAASLVFAKTVKPIEWQSLDGSQVSIIFLMAVRHRDEGKEHLKMLANISGSLMDDNFVKQIKKENDPKKLVEIFKTIKTN
ncbi:PTS sugar transporter subunit IIA [Lactiplantibacillus plantarum]|uniref:PTS sugar transporter subunit IIA n=1 Tax=Lactiplantibacillus plantarum TaxID=1590 RepID=UPI00189FBFFC|nr:fructose PTS transporter subunit IIA [Lactiplantibacillus plantarum]MDB7773082.1 fructose PTS transporter subunit IIA [Lactiplantibacillus plantarum]